MKRFTAVGEPSAEIIEDLARILLDGGVVLLPTDTIYGLHAMASSEEARARVASMKGREAEKAFVVIAASADQLRRLGTSVPDVLLDLWPAPLTAILSTASASTIAARVPALGWLRTLLERTGPLISTSANRSGEPPVTRPEALAHDLLSDLDALLDSGPIEAKPSTIVDFTGSDPRLVREGDLGFAQILRKSLRKAL